MPFFTSEAGQLAKAPAALRESALTLAQITMVPASSLSEVIGEPFDEPVKQPLMQRMTT